MRRACLVAGLAGVIGVVIAVMPGHRGWFDMSVYYGAIHDWTGGGDLYAYLRRGTYGFTYPPFAAVCMLPMALVGWHPAIAINVALTVAASAFLVYFLVDPVARARGWSRWYAFALAACAFAALNPVRDTVSFGQVNILLVALVYFDLVSLRDRRGWAGVAIGLAAAIKLTPVVFIGYLVVTRQWRAAMTAAGTATGATLFAAAVAPDATRAYFTDALWNTGRVGVTDYVSNQSLLGLASRLGLGRPLWLLLAVAVIAFWAWRCTRARDHVVGFALTGTVACLLSPISWVHHLVWLVPALALLLARRFGLGAACYVVLLSGVVWLWSEDPSMGGAGIEFLGENAYVLVTVVLLVAVPVSTTRPAVSPNLPRLHRDRPLPVPFGPAGDQVAARAAGPFTTVLRGRRGTRGRTRPS